MIKLNQALCLFWTPQRGWHREMSTLYLLNGKIVHIGNGGPTRFEKEFSCKGLIVLPGLIDSQVHFREPGLTHKEDLFTGTQAALLGGITGVFEMPNTLPPTTTLNAYEEKLSFAKDRAWTNYAFFTGGAKENLDHIAKLEALPNSPGVKVFMGSSFGTLLLDQDQDLVTLLKNTQHRVTFHCEDENILQHNKSQLPPNPHVSLHPQWRSVNSALSATLKIAKIAKSLNRQIHILHVTSQDEVEALKEFKPWVTFEVLPQHLTLHAPDCYQRLGTLAQQNPPIRELNHQKALWDAVTQGLVTTLGSDHAPHTLEEKAKPYPQSPSGMPGVQTLVSIMLNHVNAHKLTLERFTELMTLGVAKAFKLKNKGLIAPNYDADLTLIDIEKEHVIKNSQMVSKSAWTPFNDMKVKGKPISTYIGGQLCMQEDEIVIDKPSGQPMWFDKS